MHRREMLAAGSAAVMGLSAFPFGWTAALITHAIIFGSMHVYQGLAGMIGTGIIGFIIGLYYLAGGRRLFPVIIAHGIINTIGLTAYYLSDGAIT